MSPKSERSRAVKYVFERCHDLDLFRCYGGDKMEGKLGYIKRDVGDEQCAELARRTEAAIIATGDRLMYSARHEAHASPIRPLATHQSLPASPLLFFVVCSAATRRAATT
jgi:hypothetical protein